MRCARHFFARGHGFHQRARHVNALRPRCPYAITVFSSRLHHAARLQCGLAELKLALRCYDISRSECKG
jgi:hypothetical protein